MDVRDINKAYIAKNCDRTNLGVAENIDTQAVLGVQIHAAVNDAGLPAGSYYGPGELVVTDVSGRVLTPAIIVAEGRSIAEIAFNQRSANGQNFFPSPALKGASITSYNFIPYKAPSEHVAIVHTIDNSLQNFPYMLKIRRVATDNMKLKQTTVKTAYFKSAPGGSTTIDIATGLVDYINLNFNTDPLVPIKAELTGAAGDEVTISALPYPFAVGKFEYEKLNFVVELVDFDAEVEYNDKADLVRDGITHDQATAGAGNYEQVVQMERFSKFYTGANKDVQSPLYKRNVVDLETERFLANGTTQMQYDTVVVNWTQIQGDFSANVRQEGSLTFFLAVENNAASQVGVGIIDVLDAYVNTLFGVGTPALPKLSVVIP